MKTYAIYRCLYGEDFIQASIKSIDSYVDKIFIFWDDTPWGDTTGVEYKGQWVDFPKKFDNILDRIKELDNPKVELIYDHQYNNLNQFTHFVNDIILPNYDRPNRLIIPEVDHVFRKDQIELSIDEFEKSGHRWASNRQIELWRKLNYRIPTRGRMATVFWNLDLIDEFPPTRRQANIRGDKYLLHTDVHNLGFCVSKKVMYWKHLTAMAFSKKIGDSPPGEDWYEKIWLKWDINKNNRDLEISEGHESMIPYAMPYDTSQLPEVLK